MVYAYNKQALNNIKRKSQRSKISSLYLLADRK